MHLHNSHAGFLPSLKCFNVLLGLSRQGHNGHIIVNCQRSLARGNRNKHLFFPESLVMVLGDLTKARGKGWSL